MGADAQPFSFTAEDRKCTDIQGDESNIEWLRGQFQPAASSVGSLVSKPLQINPVSRKYLFIGTGALYPSKSVTIRAGSNNGCIGPIPFQRSQHIDGAPG